MATGRGDSSATGDSSAGIDAALGADLAAAALALARCFATGATMWCIAPSSPEHAHHVAVEFVHPVVMGTRALPAVSIDGPDPVAELRTVVRPGDVLLAVGTGASPVVADAMRRAQAWGATSIWLGAGDRPDIGAADHVLWTTDPDATAAYDGRLVLLYHVLWELTHVCFEHPGILTVASDGCDDTMCITCADEGRVAEVVTADDTGAAVVRTARGSETVDITMVGAVLACDLVLVHAGTAIALLDGTSR
jgi:hydrogenase maturation factor